MGIQAQKFEQYLVATQSFYGVTHNYRQIKNIIFRSLVYTAHALAKLDRFRALDITSFVEVSVSEMAKTFLHSQLHELGVRLSHWTREKFVALQFNK
jgi:hypothetical protein